MDHLPEGDYLSTFSKIPQPLLHQFFQVGLKRSYTESGFVTHRGDIWPYLLFILSGKLEAVKESEQGRSFVIDTFQAGEFFWGIALFEENKPNPVAVRAAKNSEILVWDKPQIDTAIVSAPQFAWSLFSLLAQKMGRVSEIMESLAFLPLASRLANLLIDQSGELVDGYIARDLTLDDMGARIGTTREMVCKILYNFSDQGIIDLERTQFKINDYKKLEALAKSSK